jgi:hypothetical protein
LCAGLRSAGKSELAGWGVGDFSEDGGAVGSGGGGDVAGALVQRFIGHQSEGKGFFGVFGDAKIGGGQDLDLAGSWHLAGLGRSVLRPYGARPGKPGLGCAEAHPYNLVA